ncbi:MAG: hypothetical protein QE271_00675 [Bacteriovoracaceae bacterium]|nr:hypothetical protein [Bacteriovoracaceae bacterium]
MKAWILSVIMSLSIFSNVFAQAQIGEDQVEFQTQIQDDTVLLSSKRIQVNSFETTFLRTSSSPRKVFVTAPEWKTESMCRAYDTRTVTFPCNGPCYDRLVCTGYGQNRRCRTVFRCQRTLCLRTERYCSRYESVPVKSEKTIKLVFRSPKTLKAGQEEKYYLSTANQETINSNPKLEAENAACHEIIKRRGGAKFVVKINKNCE